MDSERANVKRWRRIIKPHAAYHGEIAPITNRDRIRAFECEALCRPNKPNLRRVAAVWR